MINDKRHVLILCPFASPNIGGVESHLDKLIRVATRKGFYITLITYQPLTTDTTWDRHIEKENYQIYRTRWFGLGIFPKIEKWYPIQFIYLFPGLFLKSLTFYIKHHKSIDCIHAHGLAAATIARILKALRNKKIVLSTHAIYSFDKRRILNYVVKNILQGFDFILGVSAVSREEIIRMGIPKDKTDVHKNWVEISKFRPRDVDKSRNKHNFRKGLHVLYVGRFIEQKGVQMLINSSKQTPNVNYHFVGDGPLKSLIEHTARDSNNVIFYGSLDQSKKEDFEKLLELYSSCDYFISPYLYDEGFSATLIESLACGTPLIITNRGSPPRYITDKVAEFLSHDPTKKEIVDTLKKQNKKGSTTKTQRQRCREYALDNFGEKNAETILNQYK